MSIRLRIGSIFSIIATPIVLGAFFCGYKSLVFEMKAQMIETTVVENIQHQCETSGKRPRSYICYQAKVKYEWNDLNYEVALNEKTSSSYRVGEKLSLKIDPSNPGEANTDAGLWIFPVILGIFGAVFGSVGLFMLKSHFSQKKLEEELLTSGSIVRAKVIDFQKNRNIRVNGRHPMKISAEFTDPTTGAVIIAQNDEVWELPELPQDNQVEVRFDRNDPNRNMIILTPTYKIKAA